MPTAGFAPSPGTNRDTMWRAFAVSIPRKIVSLETAAAATAPVLTGWERVVSVLEFKGNETIVAPRALRASALNLPMSSQL